MLLVKTVKGFGMGKIGEGKNTVHQTKKLGDEDIKAFRDRFNIPIPDSQIADLPFYKPADDTPEMRYLHERRKAWAATCRTAASRPASSSRRLRWTPSRPSSKPRPKAVRSRPRRPMCVS